MYFLVCGRFKSFLKLIGTVNFVEGCRMLKPNFALEGEMLLRVALIGGSSHWRIYPDTMLSRFSQTNGLERSATVECQDIFDIYLIKKGIAFGIN